MTSSNIVVKSVAKKLKYYFEVKRLEDGFDLSNVNVPTLDHPPLKARSALQYDGLHDRPLKHYFSQPEVRVQLTQLGLVDAQLRHPRERVIKKSLVRGMKKHHFLSKPDDSSQKPKPKSNIPECYYVYTPAGRQIHPSLVGFGGAPKSQKNKALKGGWPVLRSAPPVNIPRGEAERLVNSATKLLAATETIEHVSRSRLSLNQHSGSRYLETEWDLIQKLDPTSTVERVDSRAHSAEVNFYITEEELELERKGPGTVMCSAHEAEPLALFCVQCDLTVCIICKLTKHDHHETQPLADAATRCQGQLKVSQERLENTIKFLTKKSAEANDHIQIAEQKGVLIEAEVQAQYAAIVAKADVMRDAVLEEVRQSRNSVKGRLSTDAHKIQQELDSLLQLRQRVHRALGDASDAEKVHVENEMREGQGSVERLDAVRTSVPDTTVRPGVQYDQSAVSDDDIRRFLGSPVELSLPCGPVTEVVVPIYQCGQEGACREVHSLCHVTDQNIHVSFGGTLPDYIGEDQITINGNEKIGCATKSECKDRKVTFVKYADEQLRYNSYEKITNYTLNAKNEVLIKSTKVLRDNKKGRIMKRTVTTHVPLTVKACRLFDINSEHRVAFDATKDEQLFVIIEEKTTEQSKKAEYSVQLFHRDQSDPFTTYRPPDAGFHPTDVCFWQEDGRQKLLVSDAQNDSVHVVNVEEDACHFERYLAAGNCHLVRPTALNVDDRNRVWIGCGNGWILRCEKLQESEELPCDEDGDSSESDGSVESFVIGDNSLQPMEVDFVLTVMPTRSDVSSSISHASLPVSPFLSPSSVSIRSPPSPAASIASNSSVVTEISIRSTDTLSQLSDYS